CDVANCNSYAYAEMYRIHKNWMYVCKKHYKLKLKNGKPIEKDIGFYILNKNDKPIKKDIKKFSKKIN
ncbi:MAG: hypothetical protein KJ623_00280, partial [Nanoarchaeota archaeon]|nr:hypothetical protein [Nanoarchaeota archaeon]